MSAPLAGIIVIDVSSYLAGPFVGLMLADLGADVIKIEQPPHGDPLRRFRTRDQPASPLAVNVNRGKRSVFVDLRSPTGKGRFLRLVAGADVVVQNWRPDVADSLGLGDEVLAVLNRRLVRLAITGYGPDGPMAGRRAFDGVIQAHSGLVHQQTIEGRSQVIRTYLADKTASVIGVQAVLAALLVRQRTGEGQHVGVSMLDALAYLNFPDVMDEWTFMDVPPAADAATRRAATGATADGFIVLVPGSGEQVRAVLAEAGCPERMEAIRRANLSAPEVVAAVLDAIEPVLRTRPTAYWVERFAALDVPAMAVLDHSSHLADPQVVHNRIYDEYRHPVYGRVRTVRYPARFSMSRLPPPVRPAPLPNEHEQEICADAGGLDPVPGCGTRSCGSGPPSVH